jgi:lysophospholipase L1-like esterase
MIAIFRLLAVFVFCSACAHAAEEILPIALFKNLQSGRSQIVVAYGTSLTEGGAWVPMLREWFDVHYKGQVRVVNGARSGMNSDWGLANVQKQVVERKPDLVFVEFAINDAVQRFNIPVERARANLDGILAAIRAGNPQVEIVLMTMNAAVDAPGKTAGSIRPKLADYYANYTACAAEQKLTLVDNYPAWKKLAEMDQKTFLSYAVDGVHPNQAGLMAITWPNIEKMLGAAEAVAKNR